MGVSMKLMATATSLAAYAEAIKWRFGGQELDTFERLLLQIHQLNSMAIKEYEKCHAEELAAYDKKQEQELQAKYDRGEVEDIGGFW